MELTYVGMGAISFAAIWTLANHALDRTSATWREFRYHNRIAAWQKAAGKELYCRGVARDARDKALVIARMQKVELT